MDENKKKELDEFRKALAETTPEDFDGHTTEFADLSVREKLIWLSELNYFTYVAKRSTEE